MKELQGMFRGYCFQKMQTGTCSAEKCKTCCIQWAFNRIFGGIIATDIIKDFDPEKFQTALESYCCRQMKSFKCDNHNCKYCSVNEVITTISSLSKQAQ